MKSRYWKVFLIVVFLAAVIIVTFMWPARVKTYSAARNEVVELTFKLDKKFEFGDYTFDIANGKQATYPLCFCLTEKNMFPPDCTGDVKYLYNNRPGTMCVPMHIGTGRCSSKIISSSSFATTFSIPLEYSWTKPFETIVMGIHVPVDAPIGAKLMVEVTNFKKEN